MGMAKTVFQEEVLAGGWQLGLLRQLGLQNCGVPLYLLPKLSLLTLPPGTDPSYCPPTLMSERILFGCIFQDFMHVHCIIHRKTCYSDLCPVWSVPVHVTPKDFICHLLPSSSRAKTQDSLPWVWCKRALLSIVTSHGEAVFYHQLLK